MSVIDIRTRQPVEAAPIAIDDGAHANRLERVVRNFLIDAESLGIPWTTVRAWLTNALGFVDAKIVQQQNGSKR